MKDSIKQLFVDARFILTEAVVTKLALYVALGAMQVTVRPDWTWPELILGGLLAWKTFMSSPTDKKP